MSKNASQDPFATIGISSTIIVIIMAMIASINASNLSVLPSSGLLSLENINQQIREIKTQI